MVQTFFNFGKGGGVRHIIIWGEGVSWSIFYLGESNLGGEVRM